jgi:hypothetical protein
VPGRPTKYRKEFADDLPALMSKGASVVEVCAHWDIDQSTFFAWIKAKPAFSKSYSRARVLCQAHWEKVGREALRDRDFNERLWNLNMMARFRKDWIPGKAEPDDDTVLDGDKGLLEQLLGGSP